MENHFKQQPSPHLRRIVLFGPESTGKTTLAQQLAAHYNTLWVPEYMRTYYEEKWQGKPGKSKKTDLIPIAKGQMELENELAKAAEKFLFCDTNLLEIKVYAEAYFNGFCPPEIATFALQNAYELYFLTYIDTPWEADGLRDKPMEREVMFGLFEKALIEAEKPYVILKGNQDKRLQKAIEVLEAWN